MARATAMEALNSRIGKAQALVSKRKKLYDEAAALLSDLLDKREALQRDELVKAILKSGTYEEVLKFLRSAPEEEE